MSLTLLLDLDDTLLDTNMNEFLPAYFQALANHLDRWVRPEAMLAALSSGTRQMMANEDPALTLQEVFEQKFFSELGVEKASLRGVIEEFYGTEFKSLGSLTTRRPGAVELVESAMGRGSRVAIATDPLFPREATYERIRWAGLTPERFDVVSSYESFHFTKSHPAYYAEVLGRLGWPEGPVLMVGNDSERDLQRAQELGLATFQIDASSNALGGGERATPDPRSVGHGTLEDLCRWLELSDLSSLEPSFKGQDAILAILLSTPAALHGLVADLTLDEWRREPTPDDWAMIEIVSHLRDTEREVHHAQVRTLLDETQPFVPRPDAAVWAKQRNYLDEDGEKATAEFIAARKQTLAQLRGLEPGMWNRSARHAIFGPTNFTEVVGFMADHDRLHLQQAWRTLHARV